MSRLWQWGGAKVCKLVSKFTRPQLTAGLLDYRPDIPAMPIELASLGYDATNQRGADDH